MPIRACTTPQTTPPMTRKAQKGMGEAEEVVFVAREEHDQGHHRAQAHDDAAYGVGDPVPASVRLLAVMLLALPSSFQALMFIIRLLVPEWTRRRTPKARRAKKMQPLTWFDQPQIREPAEAIATSRRITARPQTCSQVV